ncbi:MAG: bifunctional 5,10-methylenetetrahydrofolate dehydrogenase/5,10-methenyltetrahydrofolate cyclohydrolase [Candidatus Gracilibacteria bacterium]|nr:bifunctional 5,10-methylenetetrahydrofolate dehydrogenase/5,10-methenyltetrahydrofolate cyclohydrolase [Candidatus Gracilibacteria bacterium]
MIIDGRSIAQSICAKLGEEGKTLPRKPKLSVILVGENPASLSYIRQKERFAGIAGIDFELRQLSVDTTENALMDIIHEVNGNRFIDGLIVQLPLPRHIDTNTIIEAIDPRKDVDGFTSQNIGKLFLGTADLISCTPKGIMRLLETQKTKIQGENIVVIGKSNIVGKPLSLLLMNAGGTVTVCNKDTKDIGIFTQSADIIVVAAGSPGLLKKAMVRPGTTVIDVGCTPVDGKFLGDTDFQEIEPLCRITPVPGGVGPMTVAMLMENTHIAAKNQM